MQITEKSTKLQITETNSPRVQNQIDGNKKTKLWNNGGWQTKDELTMCICTKESNVRLNKLKYCFNITKIMVPPYSPLFISHCKYCVLTLIIYKEIKIDSDKSSKDEQGTKTEFNEMSLKETSRLILVGKNR